MDLLQIIVLALVQGITEFIPVSSSAHLLLVPVFANWPDQGLAYDVALHVGSLFAVLIYFRREIGRMCVSWFRSIFYREWNEDSKLAWAVVLGTIPVGAAALIFRDLAHEGMRSPLVTAFGLIVFGVALGWAGWRSRGERSEYQMTRADVFYIGCAQALALIPGTSRSGITLTAALLLGLSREAAARFSFLLSIPVIVLAGLVETRDLVRAGDAVDWNAVVLGTLISGVSAFLCIHYFLVFIKKIGVQPFVVYRIGLGVLLLFLFW